MFDDRTEAGRLLAERLEHLRGTDAVVVGLPRGGVPVAYQVAVEVELPLDVSVVRKIGVPWQPELAMGAVGEGAVTIVDSTVIRVAGVTEEEFASAQRTAAMELELRVAVVRDHRARIDLTDKTVIVVDDGIATGATARAACRAVRVRGAERVIMAAPVGSQEAVDALKVEVDEVVCLLCPTPFHAVGEWYVDFDQTTDEEMIRLMRQATSRREP